MRLPELQAEACMNVRVALSSIHGHGVFANEHIEEGQWQYVYGELRHIKPGDPFEHYGLEWDNGYTYMPYGPWCCVNHGDKPNCEVYADGEDEHPIIYITALRDIEPGEELTIDYGYDPSED